MKQPHDWSLLDLAGDPLLIVGQRPRPRTLEAFAIDLHKETHGTMRGIASATINCLSSRESVPWHSYAAIEPGEQYLSVDVSDLPSIGTPSSEESHEPPSPFDSAADLIRLVLNPGELANLPQDLSDAKFRFYAVVYEAADGGSAAAFVSEYDPVAVLRKASAFFRFDGTLRSTRAPDFTLDGRADLIVTADEVAVLKPAAFDHLFSDIRAALNDVPAYTTALKTAMTSLPMSPSTEEAIRSVCRAKPSLAKQLWNLSRSAHACDLTAPALEEVLRRHDRDPNEFLNDGVLAIGPGQVGALLDVTEGRWYEADFTGEPRRAARWSRR